LDEVGGASAPGTIETRPGGTCCHGSRLFSHQPWLRACPSDRI